MSEYIILVCACGNVSGITGRELSIADFLRGEIEEGWREIRERDELYDAQPPADLPTAPPGAEKFEFRGICAGCAAKVEQVAEPMTATEVLRRSEVLRRRGY